MEKRHMNLRLRSKTLWFSLCLVLGFSQVQAVFAATDESEGDIIESQCGNLDESLAGALGCDTSDEVLDFTEYGGELEPPDDSGYDEALTQNRDAREFIQTIVNFALGFLGLVAVVIVIYGGSLYVLSRGDEEMATNGKKSISYAAIGIVIILGSFALVNTLLQAGGGDSAGGVTGGDVDGTTITETGASFDTEYVLNEIEDISAEYIDAYETLLAVSQQVAYMKSVEMPIIIEVEEKNWTLGGLAEAVQEWFQGNLDSDYADQYELIDEDDVEDYIDMLREGVQDIQQDVDSLSDTYEAAQALYNYLRSGTQSSFLNRFFATLVPQAEALDVEEVIREIAEGNSTTDSLCNTVDYPEVTYNQYGVGVTIYEIDIREIDENVCGYLEAIQSAAERDYTKKLRELINRFDEIGLLFDTDSFDSGSKLTKLKEAFDASREVLSSASDTEQISASTTQGIVFYMNELYTLVQDLKFVSVRLSASTVSGNAPLIVRFDVLGTEDPSGKTVLDDNIEWDLDGDGNFETALRGSTGVTATDLIGDAVSATYTDPGTYRVRVRVRSQDANIAAGVSTVTIEVEPSKSRVVLTAQVGTEAPFTIADFTKFPAVDQNSFKVTKTEAESGILFDATGTTDGDGNGGTAGGIIFYEWDFGDNETASGPYGQSGGNTVTHAYSEAGAYNASLTVTDDTGVKDRKYFTLYVASPAARYTVTPSSGTVGTRFELDASGSTTDIGNIVSTSWSANKAGISVPLESNTGETSGISFDSPGIYTVTLTVSDGSGKTDTASGDILVESSAPIASYEYSIPNSAQPATYLFDAGGSSDPDEGDVLTFEWDFGGVEGQDYEILESDENSEILTVQFLKEGDFDVMLTAHDQHAAELKRSDTAITTLSVDSILDLDLEVEGDTARHLDGDGEAEIEFTASSETATAFEIDYGDGTVDFTDTITRGEIIFTHVYESAGIFYVTLSALDDDDGRNSITERIYVGAGDAPIAVIGIGSNGEDIGDAGAFYGNIKTQFTFDARESINVDGTKDGLEYSWNFGDGVTASQATVTHTFAETAVYTVTLTVRDEDDNALTGENSLTINIEGIDPEIYGITVVPQGDALETPLKVNVSVDAADEDGKITYYNAWYYDLKDTAKKLGSVTSQSSNFTMTIDTKGETGEVVEYGFAVEVKDNQNNEVSSFDELEPSEIPTLNVTNGPNETPVVGFSVDRTAVYIGEEITFSSTSYDLDGEIVSYWWDIEGDGFYNNEASEEASFTYAFSQVHPEGVKVQLKVEDNSGATNTSNAITVYVDSIAAAPDAAFLTSIDGTTVSFTDNSVIDAKNGAKLVGIYWDFNTFVDSNGNGIADDDYDSFENNPVHTYAALGTYSVKLAIVDSSGQTDAVTREIHVLDTQAPEAAFSATVSDKTVDFKNESTYDQASGAEARSTSWDLNLTADSNGDTDPENDVDATTKNPSTIYDDYGEYKVKLIVEDSFGKTDTVIQTVKVSSPMESPVALLTSSPQPNSLSQVILKKDGDQVTFYYGAEGGSGSFNYEIDKNIFYDTDGDGIRDNDNDFDDDASGSWKTPFYTSYGQIVVKLTVTDSETGETDLSTLQVVFEGSLGSANLFNATPAEMMLLIVSALIAAIVGVSLTFKSQLLKR